MLAVSLPLSLTLSPVLLSCLSKGGSEDDTRLVRWLRKPYDRMLGWAIAHRLACAHRGCAVCGVAVAVPIAGHLLIPEVAEGTLSPMRIACQTFAGGVAQHWNEACRSRCRKCPACSTWCRMWAVRNRPPTQLVTTIQRPSTSWSRSATPEPTASRMTFFSGIPMRCCHVPGPLALFASAKTTGAPLILPPAGIGRFAASRTGAPGGLRVPSKPCKRYHLGHAALP